jgi:hypothetical protein
MFLSKNLIFSHENPIKIYLFLIFQVPSRSSAHSKTVIKALPKAATFRYIWEHIQVSNRMPVSVEKHLQVIIWVFLWVPRALKKLTRFISASNTLAHHRRVHSGEKVSPVFFISFPERHWMCSVHFQPFTCGINNCIKKFTRNESMVTHQRTLHC